MPVCYGGGITSFEEIKKLLRLGVEKVALCTAALERPEIITVAANALGNQSILGVVEVVKKGVFGGQEASLQGGKRKAGISPVEAAQKMVAAGAGEIMINHIERDGVMAGYDIDLVNRICDAVNVPVIACGGQSLCLPRTAPGGAHKLSSAGAAPRADFALSAHPAILL